GWKNPPGAVDDVYSAVRRAPIAADGSLSAWIDCRPLPVPDSAQAFAQDGTHVYLVSGVSKNMQGLFLHDFVLVGTIGDDGDVTWAMSSRGLGAAFMHGTGAVLDGTLYAIGGTGAMQVPQALVMRATLGADGMPGP